MDGEAAWRELREQVAADVRRVANRLRHLSAAQLAAPPEPRAEAGSPEYVSRAAAGRAAAESLAEAAAFLEAIAGAGPERPLPEVSSHVLGDVVAVTGSDLLAAMDQVAPDTEVRHRDGCPGTDGRASERASKRVSERASARTSVRAAVEEAARRLADVRRRI